MDFDNFTGYVLAGGKSSRMKTDKAFLRFADETFLSRAVKTLSTVCQNRVKIVLNKMQMNYVENLPDQVPHIFDCFESRGALGGIHAALTDCQSEWAIILAVDLPFVSSAAIRGLKQIAFESKEFSAVVPIQNDGRLQPLCAVYRVNNCLPKLENLLNKTTFASVKDFLKLIPARRVEQSELTSVADEDLFFNVNHPSDFQILSSSNH